MSKTPVARLDFWRQLVAKQQQSGISVRVFCQQHRTSEYSFYHWRKRLAEQLPMKFALVETSQSASVVVAMLEFAGGPRGTVAQERSWAGGELHPEELDRTDSLPRKS